LDNFLISIVGATAIGKTTLSIALARAFKTEILSCDARQFYKEMQIGTAVPSNDELAQVKHHFIQNLSIHNTYSVGQFETDALLKLEQLFAKNNPMIMVGGSGLYVDAVLKGLDYFPDIDSKVRDDLNKILEIDGILNLQAQLEYLDPETYRQIDVQNPHRVIRALEVCLGSDKPFSYYKNKPKAKRNFKTIKIGLDADRKEIYRRIEQRVDIMLQEGLLKEVRKMYPYKDLNALQTVGYRELFQYLDGSISLDFAISEIKKNTRRFAKRQNTWFKKDKEITWFDYQTDYDEIIGYVIDKMKNQNKISH
jgi:tRNA dimethylallyltransferase